MKHVFRSSNSGKVGWAAGLVVVVAMVAVAGAQQDRHGRKWKPLPPLAHIEVTVVKGFDGKPLPNAAVVFHSTLEGRDNGNLEVKTNPEGKAIIDLIEVGSDVDVQVIAKGFSTYSKDLNQVGATKSVEVKLLQPREQMSQYENTEGKPAVVKPGIQEPPHPVIVPPKVGPDGYALAPASPPAAKPAPASQPADPTGTPQ